MELVVVFSFSEVVSWSSKLSSAAGFVSWVGVKSGWGGVCDQDWGGFWAGVLKGE